MKQKNRIGTMRPTHFSKGPSVPCRAQPGIRTEATTTARTRPREPKAQSSALFSSGLISWAFSSSSVIGTGPPSSGAARLKRRSTKTEVVNQPARVITKVDAMANHQLQVAATS